MNGQIRHLHCRFRVLAGRDSATAAVSRLDRIARQHLEESFSAALDQAFGDDPAVYVLRQVKNRLTLAVGSNKQDLEISHHWGKKLAGTVVRQLNTTSNSDPTSPWVRFDNQADYVAHFINDLLAGQAWQIWFYSPFTSLRSLDRGKALRRVLEEHSERLPDILSNLHQDKALDTLLAAMNRDDRRWLWLQVRGSVADVDSQAARGLFMAALYLAERLEGWSLPSPDVEALFLAYLVTGPVPTDWRDRTGLAAAVLDVLHFLATRGYIRTDRCATNLPPVDQDALDSALADFDWLDKSWLKAGLHDLLRQDAGRRSTLPGDDLPLPRWASGPTPRMRQVLIDLAAALKLEPRGLDAAHPSSTDNAVRLYTWLVSYAPVWMGDPLAAGLIENLLSAWAWVSRASSPTTLLRSLAQGDRAAALNALTPTLHDRAAGAIDFLAGAGPEGLAVVETLVRSVNVKIGAGISDTGDFDGDRLGIDLDCVGVTLLLRAILDAQLPALAKRAGYPQNLSSLLLGLYLCWSGPEGIHTGRVGAGLSYMAGLDSPPLIEDVSASWSVPGLADFETAWLDTLVAQRMLTGTVLHLYRLSLGGENGWALVAGDESGQLWPLGRSVESPNEVATVMAGWRTSYLEATGISPTIIIDDELGLEDSWPPEAQIVPLSAADDALAVVHRLGCERLQAAWVAMDNPPPALVPACLIACSLLRLWARWLRQFSESSIPYLLERFIHRSGRLYLSAGQIWVELERHPLDIVIELAGYMAPLEGVPWLGGRTVFFRTPGG